jgi:hypothetical protein
MQGVAAGGGQPQAFPSVSQPCMTAGMLCWLGLGGVFCVALLCCSHFVSSRLPPGSSGAVSTALLWVVSCEYCTT